MVAAPVFTIQHARDLSDGELEFATPDAANDAVRTEAFKHIKFITDKLTLKRSPSPKNWANDWTAFTDALESALVPHQVDLGSVYAAGEALLASAEEPPPLGHQTNPPPTDENCRRPAFFGHKV